MVRDVKEPATLIEEYHEKTIKIAVWTLQIITYRLDSKYVCIVNNPDPGATICRVCEATREGAQRLALERANEHLSRTVNLDVYKPDSNAYQLARISNTQGDPPRDYTVSEFMEVPMGDRMNYILSGSLVFYGARDELIPSGAAMKLLHEACA